MTDLADEALKAAGQRSYDALWERVDNQGRAIQALAEETSAANRDIRADFSRGQSELASSLKALDVKMDSQTKATAEQNRPQYAALFVGILSAIGVSVTIIQWQQGLHDHPVDDKLNFLTASISDLAKNTTNGFAEMSKSTVSQQEFQLTNGYLKQIGDLKSAESDVRRATLTARIDKLADTQVSRSEHQFHWDAEDKRDAALEHAIDAINHRLDELAPASDVIKRLSDQTHELELRVFGASAPAR